MHPPEFLPGVQIGRCPANLRRTALELLHADAAAETRERHIADTLSEIESLEAGGRGTLLAAVRNATVVGAALGLVQPGRSAVVQSPQLIAGEREPVADSLLQQLDEWFDGRGIRVAQALVDPLDLLSGDRLQRGGYQQACTLCYLVCGPEHFPGAAPAGPLEFAPWRPADDERLAHVIEATYEQTKDCPSLNGVRTTTDVLAGYRATPAGANGPWFVAKSGAEIVGCLFLADHHQTDQYELMYMGVVQRCRGRGYGRWLVAEAQWATQRANRSQLVLGVDAQNEPAREIYASHGFRVFSQRLVYLRIAPL